jgi:hypothetical protein
LPSAFRKSRRLRVGDLDDGGIPVVFGPIDHMERVCVDDELALRVFGDVKDLERPRGRILEYDGRALDVFRSEAVTVKPIFGVAPGNSASEMRALAVGGDDPAGRVK